MDIKEKRQDSDNRRRIGPTSKEIGKKTRVRLEPTSKKIDLFEKYMKENGTKEIHSNTVFEGYPIGSYLIAIRQSIRNNNGKVKYNENDKERLEKLGLLYETDSIEEKIERLKNYCKKYPYAFSNINDLKEKFEAEENIDEVNKLEELYKSSYRYIISRREAGAVSKDVEKYIKEAKIGGVFGLSKEDEELAEKYNINNRIISRLNMEFGSIDNFRKDYIQYKIDLSKAKTDEETQRIFNKNSNIRKYLIDNNLPIVKDFYCGKEKYSEFITYTRLIYAILWKGVYSERGIVVDDEAYSTLKLMCNELTGTEKEVIDLNFGIKEGETKSLNKIANCLNIEKKEIERILQNFVNRPEMAERKKHIVEHIYEPTEEFVKAYFEVHDIFYSEEEPQMTQENIDNLMKGYKEQRKAEEEQKKLKLEEMHSKGIFFIDEIDLSARAYRNLTRNGIKTTSELLERIEKLDDFHKIRITNKKSINEVVDKIHSLGLKFKFEEENEKTIKQELVQKVLDQQKIIAKQKKELEELRAINNNKEL